MNKRKIGSLILSIALITGSFSNMSFADSKSKFNDLKDTYWATEFIKVLVDSGILSGYANGTFQPEKGITREEFAVVLFKTFGLDETKPATPSFKDVDASKWSFGYVEAAKAYLTGYFPPNGKATFVPEGAATREDVAVALVRALSLDEIEKGNPEDLDFDDTSDISPGLRDEIAIAMKHQLISGFPDNTFRPDAPLTRAQASAMIYKVIKATWTESNVTYATEIKMPEKVTTNAVPITINLPEKSKLFINDELIAYSGKTYSGTWKINEGPGSYTFKFKVQYPNNKIENLSKTVLFEASAPVLNISNWNATSDKEFFIVKGNTADSYNSHPILKINGQETVYPTNNKFEIKLPLKKGDNPFVFTVIDKMGKVTEVTKTIQFNVAAPVISMDMTVPEKVSTPKLTLKFSVKDLTDSYPLVYVNGSKVEKYFFDSNYSVALTLKEGINDLLIEAKNKQGLSSVKTYRVVYEIGAPQITFVNMPETSDKAQINMGLKVTDAYDYDLDLFVNDKKYTVVNNDVKNIPFTLVKGENKIVFKAINSKNKITNVEKVIVFDTAAPKVALSSATTTIQKAYTLKLTVSDLNYKPEQLSAKINGRVSTVTSAGTVSFVTELLDGNNLMNVEIGNPDGKVTKVAYTIAYETKAPEVSVSLPATSKHESVEYTITAADPNKYPLTFTINDKPVAAVQKADGSYEIKQTVKLALADNSFKIIASAEATGKSTTVTKVIKFVPDAPVINLSEVPATVTVDNVTFTGNISDLDDPAVVLTIGGEAVTITASGNFTKSVTLVPGENKISIKATNKHGLITEITKTIKYDAPVIPPKTN